VIEGTNSATLLPADFKFDATGLIGTSGQMLLATKTVKGLRYRSFRLAGNFDTPMNGQFYPFDRHRLRFDLRAWIADDQLLLSREIESLSERPQADGWTVGESYVALNSRETSPVFVSSELQSGESSQFDAISITVNVRRKLWNAFLLIVFPLALLMLASVAVLFIKFQPSGASQGASATVNDFEARKTQTELSLGCMLAVITYLISYATLAPRLERLIYSDLLVGFTLLIAVFNFVFLVAISDRQSSPLLRRLCLEDYRIWISIISALGIIVWALVGLTAN